MKTRVGFALLAATLVAADTPDEAAKQEKQKLQGTWVLESAEADGKRLEKIPSLKFVFSGDKLSEQVDGKEREQLTYAIDPTKTPKHINLISEKDGKKYTNQGIYQLDGDTLKICTSGDRPGKFEAKDAITMTFKRDKK